MQFVRQFGLAALALALASPGLARADIVVYAENAGVQATTVTGVSTETFNESPPLFAGRNYSMINASFGTFTSPGMAIVAADVFGGANGSNYMAIGAESGTLTATLALNTAQSFFGMWWSAADAGNSLQFYSGSTLVGTFNSATALADLGSAYLGNPNGGDAGEKFAYLDFYGTAGTTFDKVVFNNATTNSGFELDNVSVATNPSAPGGGQTQLGGGITASATPEPASLTLLGMGTLGLLGFNRVRRKRAAA